MAKLEQFSAKGGRVLRKGYTTGTCAASAAKAAAAVLLGGELVPVVKITTPAGLELELEVEQTQVGRGSVLCGVRKDAGDDPDVTHGAIVRASVEIIPEGFVVIGGEGIGIVTRPGLQCKVGERAINPVPLAMIRDALQEMALQFGYHGGLKAEISVPAGEEIAKKTFNSRLGIIGGISILGTTGIVEPMSEAAINKTIQAEINQQRAEGAKILLLTPGNYGREFIAGYSGRSLPNVKCSNYIGEALDFAVYSGFEHILLIGHAGKLVKLAAGVMNTHSSVADARMEVLAAHCALQGLNVHRVEQIFRCITVDEADSLLCEWSMEKKVWNSIASRVQYHLEQRVKARAEIAFMSFAQRGIVMRGGAVESLLPILSGTK